MAVLKKYSPLLNLGKAKVFIDDSSSDSPYFNVTELERTLTGGKNAFLFEGSSFFVKGSKVRFEALDVNGNPLYIEPGKQGDRTFREGNSIVMSIHVYDDTPIGVGTLRILAELETYIDDRGRERKVPEEFRGIQNVRWTQQFKINPKIPNKTQVRFFKRPSFSVTEIEKPLLVKTEMTLNKSGSVSGIPEVPDSGSDFSTWTAPSQYRIKLEEGNKFTQSMEENTTLQIPSLGYSSSVLEVINADEMLVRKPFLINNIVHEFQPVSYSLQFESVEDAVVTGSNVTASYAEIRLENLKTFTGDVARIKIFRKSRNDLGDFQVVQENKLDATELLRDFSVENRTVINYGKLRRENIVSEAGDVYYTTSSGVEIHNDKLINSLEVKGNHSIESNGAIGEFEIVSGSEYSFGFTARYSGSGESISTDTLRFLIVTSSNNTTNALVTSQSIDLLSGSIDRDPTGLGNIQRIQKNFFAKTTGKCQIRVEANTDSTTGRFLFSRLSLKNAEESSYSPDEYTAIVDIPRKNPTEQFDFRVEFYDINNNFIPIKVEQSVPFTKGNQALGLEASINVKNSGIADAGDILNVEGGVVQIASTNIQSSTIAGLGDPTNFSQELAVATSSLAQATASLQSATASLGADISGSLAAGAQSASNAAESASAATLIAITGSENAVLSGSLSASIAITGNQNAVLSGSAFATIAGDNSVLSGSAFAGNAALSASVSGTVDPSTGKLTKNPTPSGDGLFLGADNLGFYESDTWKTYMSSSGQFFLSGTGDNSLEWTGEQLQIKGDITASTGNIGGFTLDDNKLIGFVNAGATKAVQLDSGQSGDWTFDGDDVGGFLLTTSGSGAVNSVVNNAWVAEPNQKKFYFRVGSDNQFIKFQQRDSAGGLEISASNFSVSGSVVEAQSASFEHVSITSKDNVFSVSPAGRMIANDADIKGDISASGGSIGGFTIQGDQLLGSDSALILDGSGTPKIKFVSSSVDVVTLSSQNSLSPIVLSGAPTMLGSSFTSQNDSDLESFTDFFAHSLSITQSPTTMTETITTGGSGLRFPDAGNVSADFDGVTATFTGTLDPQTASNPFVSSVMESFNGVVGFGSNSCKIGIRIKKSDGTVVSSTERTLSTSYVGGGQAIHTLGTSGSHAFSLGVDLESGENYSFETFIKDGSSFMSATAQGVTLSSTFRTPDIGAISVSVPTSTTIQPFTEISRGGFQVVSDANPSALKVVKLPADQSAANALSVSGSIEASGNITAFASSDERLKENITTIPDSLEKVKNLRGILFNWKDGYTPKVHPYGTNRDIGVIAQEIQKVLPEVVKENVHNKFLGVKYEKLTPLLLEAIKELSDKIENLENKLKDK